MKFTADTHFGAKRALELSRRPYKTVEEMDEDIISLWNSIVKPNEEVWHLGDFGNYEIVKRLNGNIHLIIGNYEQKDIDEGKETKESLLSYGFASIEDYHYLKIDDNFDIPNIDYLKLVHKPSDCDMNNPKVFNLFGHIHGRQLCKKFGLDVGVDGHHMRPIDAKDVSFFVVAIKEHYDYEVFL